MARPDHRILVTIPISHFCEKARWAPRAGGPRVRGAPPHPDHPPARGAPARRRQDGPGARHARRRLRRVPGDPALRRRAPACCRAAVPRGRARAQGGRRARGPLRHRHRRRGPALALPRGVQGPQALHPVQPHRRARLGAARVPVRPRAGEDLHQPLPRHRRRHRGPRARARRRGARRGRRALVRRPSLPRRRPLQRRRPRVRRPLRAARRTRGVRHATTATGGHARRHGRADPRLARAPRGPLRDAPVRRAASLGARSSAAPPIGRRSPRRRRAPPRARPTPRRRAWAQDAAARRPRT